MRRARRSENGVTLVELLVSVVILSMITGALASAFVTSLTGSRPTNQRAHESNDAQIIAAFLVRDAQSAGTIDPSRPGAPTTGATDPYSDVGVSLSDNAGCSNSSPGAAPMLRFKWFEPTATYDATTHERIVKAHVVVYYFVGTQIMRTICDGTGRASTFPPGTAPGTAVSLVLGSNISASPAPAASCTTAAFVLSSCGPPLPENVSMHIYETNDPANWPQPYEYTLNASLRPQEQIAPTGSTATAIALLALGGTCGDGVTGVAAQGGGNSTVTVYGGAQVNGGCPAVDFQGSIDFVATGGISVLAPGTCQGTTTPCGSYSTPMGDPFAGLPAPAGDCATGTHPAPSGNTYSPGVYRTKLVVGDATFNPGIYIFCDGLETSGTVTATGVLFYFKQGHTLNVTDGNFSASAQTSGLYGSGSDGANIVVWQAVTNTTQMRVCCNNNIVANFGGTIYAPGAILLLHNGSLSATAIIARGVAWEAGGNGFTIIGTAPPSPLAITAPPPATLPGWTVNRLYPPGATGVATGGSGGNVWSATGLPAGMSIDPLSGLISGTPTAANTYAVVLTVMDSIGETDSQAYTLRINANPTISNPQSLPNWTINRDYPGTAIIVSGGTSPFTWSTTAMPPGLSLNGFGVVTGTPSALGTTAFTVTVVDASGVSATRNYSITINSPPAITGPNSLPTDVTAGLAYPNTTVTGASGTTPYSWNASGLPPGLTINVGSGTISGTPTTAGTYNITVTLTDAAGATATRPYLVTIKPGPGIATGGLPIGEINRPYNFTVQPTGTGTPPYTWTATGLPAGLSIGLNTGTISGTPTVSGSFANARVTITDAQGASASKTYTLVIAAAPTINAPGSLKNWTINRDYPGTQETATGGVTPFTWSATGLPAGLSINSSGLITGTPTTTGTSTVIVTVVDSLGGTGTRNYTVTINDVPSVATTSLPDGERTVPYSTSITGASGTPPYNWAASGLPGGLSINAASGVLSGTPTVAGAFDITFTVTDVAGASASSILTITLTPAPTIDAGTLPDWTVGPPYPSTTITNTGGQAPFTWSATNMPPGLTIGATTGTISGTPTTANTYSIVVKVTDSLGGTATQTYVVKISAAPTITTGSIPSWTVNRLYTNVTMTSAGGTQPISWSATGLPTGLSIDPASGVISGTPTFTGTFTPTVTVLDSVGVTGTRNYIVTVNGDPSITTVSLPDGEQSLAYSTTVAGTGGTTPYTWSATGLPAGLSISSGGTISGTPSVTGTFTVNLALTDKAGATAPNQSVSITLYPQLLVTAPASLQPWTISQAYPPTTATATGGTGTYGWSATGLPSGMSIDPSTGVISGTPTVSGPFAVNVTVTDTASPPVSKSRAYPLTINPALAITTTSCTERSNRSFSFQLLRTGGTGPFTWSGSGLPVWATVSAAGVLSGTTGPNNNYPFSVTVTDATGATRTVTFTIIVQNGNGNC